MNNNERIKKKDYLHIFIAPIIMLIGIILGILTGVHWTVFVVLISIPMMIYFLLEDKINKQNIQI